MRKFSEKKIYSESHEEMSTYIWEYSQRILFSLREQSSLRRTSSLWEKFTFSCHVWESRERGFQRFPKKRATREMARVTIYLNTMYPPDDILLLSGNLLWFTYKHTCRNPRVLRFRGSPHVLLPGTIPVQKKPCAQKAVTTQIDQGHWSRKVTVPGITTLNCVIVFHIGCICKWQ